MRQAGWYIVQTQAGMELAMCQAIQRACEGVMAVDPHLPQNYEDLDIAGTPLLQECFVPMFVHRLKLKGEWVDVEKPLLPGYLVTVTTDPVTLPHRLRTVRAFSRLLRMGEAIVPLRDDERAWLEEATKPAERTVPISIAYRECILHAYEITSSNYIACTALMPFDKPIIPSDCEGTEIMGIMERVKSMHRSHVG